MDVLADLLTRARARGAVFAHSRLGAPWGLEFTDDAPLSFHAVLHGELHVERFRAERGWSEPPVRLMQGDVLLVRTDAPYRFVHAPGAPSRPLLDVLAEQDTIGPGRLDLGGPGAQTELLCGAYSLQGAVCDSLLDALPPLMPLPGAQAADPALRTALGLLAEEVTRSAPGQQTVLDRLLDLLLVYALRAWFARPDADAPAWYRALDDPAVGPALAAMHAAPEAPWTVASLAEQVSLSRAAFARRFAARVGESPLAYLTRWRMGLAAEALLAPGASIAAVARQTGYANEFAFSAAFKRHHGQPPGRFRAERAAA